MVDASYMQARPAPPGAFKRFVDQAVMPVAIDAAGGFEAGVERVAIAVRQRPALAIGTGVLLGLTVMRLVLRVVAGRR